jgi:hypothetical protein
MEIIDLCSNYICSQFYTNMWLHCNNDYKLTRFAYEEDIYNIIDVEELEHNYIITLDTINNTSNVYKIPKSLRIYRTD